ncbi:integral membrane protein [Canariomyces notabilis]|uniref:Integral membrane protein n=1 Tax=Canariomyces notabilis TaxID=2074819 RepID=A0AAN6QK75_9PEZI|nr:integral membrane protein [Canariomyces arenarius]
MESSLSSLPPVDLSENRQPNLYASSTIPFSLATICVVLRFWCRWVKRTRLWYDDWLVLVACVCSAGLTANMLWWIPRGLGRHVQTFGPNVVEYFSIGLFTAELTYTGVIVFVKFSILAFYWRIFAESTSIKLPIAVMASAAFMWGVAVFLLTVLQCIPTRGFWDKTIESSCNVDSQKFLFAISIPNILIDVILLAMPTPYVLKLNLRSGQKRAILSIFFLGGFVCIASIMRLVAVVTEKTDADVTWNLINQAIWAVVEANFAIISACLPTLRPVWLAIRGARHRVEPSNAPKQPPTIGGSSQKRTPASWATLILKSAANATVVDNDSDSQPFAERGVQSVSHDDLGDRLVPGSQKTMGTAEAIPLSEMDDRQVPQRQEGIIIKNGWDVQYSLSPPKRDGA